MIKQELKQIAEQLIEKNKLPPIKIQFKNICGGGSARYNTRKITIPYWAIQAVKEYAIYYLIHELSHFIAIDNFQTYGHGKIFKEIEKTILKKYNIIPDYAKAYPKALYNLQGERLCGKYGKAI